MMERSYRLAGLGCAHCGAKIEQAVGGLPGVQSAALNLPAQTLSLRLDRALDLKALDGQVARISGEIEDGVVALCLDEDQFVERQRADEKARKDAERQEMLMTALGAALLLTGALLSYFAGAAWGIPSTVIMLLSYAVLGYPILKNGWKALLRKDLDEQFLMSAASLGALALGEVGEGAAVMLFYRVGEWLQDRAVHRSRGRISALMSLRPDVARLLIGAQFVDTPAHAVVPGDVIEVRPGERVPLDGEVTGGASDVDASALTGESMPVAVAQGAQVQAGCVNLTGVLTLRVLRPASESAVARIMDLTQRAAEQKASSERWITNFARRYTPAVIALATLIAVVPGVITGDFRHWVYVGLITLMLSCPCALVLSAPLTFFTSIGAASRRGILFKGGQAVESAATVDAVGFDKTGTLTGSQPVVAQVVPAGNTERDQLLSIAAMIEQRSSHPIAQAILTAHGARPDEAQDFRELAGEGVTCARDGRTYAAGNLRLMARMAAEVPPAQRDMPIHIAEGNRYLGSISLGEQIRPDARRTLDRLSDLGIHRRMMLTGDSIGAARPVCEALSIAEVKASLTPGGKAQAIQAYQASGGRIAFVGDGINDAPVLATADVGIVMGAGGRDAAIEAGDVVLMRDALSGVADAVKLSRKTMSIFRQNIALALIVKAAVVVLGMFGLVSMWLALLADVGAALLCVLNAVRAGEIGWGKGESA